MKKICCILLVMTMLCSRAMADISLESMSFDELTALQMDIEEEMRTRNVKKLDLGSLNTIELQELILQSLYELCSREEFGEVAFMNQQRSIKSWYSSGAFLLFNDTEGNLFNLILTDDNIERSFKTELEKTIEEAAQIQIRTTE